MGSITDAFNQVWRDDVVDGMPLSGINQPSKADARSLGAKIEAFINSQLAAFTGGGGFMAHVLDVSRSETAVVATGDGQYYFRPPHAIDLAELRASVKAGTTTGAITIMVNVNGTDILSSPIQIDATKTTSVGSAAPPAIIPADVIIPDNAVVRIDVDGAGDGTATGLKVYLIGAGTTVGELTMPYVVGVGVEANNSSFGSLNVPYPAGYTGVANDVALILVGAATQDPIRPSGWSLIGTSNHFSLFWKRLAGGESGSQTVSLASNDNIGGIMSIWRNCVQMGNPYESYAANAGTGNVMTGQTVVTLGDARRVLSLYLIYGGFSSATYDSDPDTGWTALYDDRGTLSGGFRWQSEGSAQAAPVAASVAAESRSIVNTPVQWVAHALALVPGTL